MLAKCVDLRSAIAFR